MADYSINESGMSFIANTDDTYHIEKSQAFLKVGRGVKTVEFIRQVRDKLQFIEAKFNKEFVEKFNVQKHDICEKFLHSIGLFCSVTLGVTPDIIPFTFNSTNIQLILVISGGEKEDCFKIERILTSALAPYLKIWNADVSVFNEKDAKDYNLIS